MSLKIPSQYLVGLINTQSRYIVYTDSKVVFKGGRCAAIVLLIIRIFQDLSKTSLELITITFAGERKWPWIWVVKIMGPVLAVPKCEQYLIRLRFTTRPEGKVLK